jgi:hypothetical protein
MANLLNLIMINAIFVIKILQLFLQKQPFVAIIFIKNVYVIGLINKKLKDSQRYVLIVEMHWIEYFLKKS